MKMVVPELVFRELDELHQMSHNTPPRADQEAAQQQDAHTIPVRKASGAVFMDADLRVMAADPQFYSSFNVTPNETEGRLLEELGSGQWGGKALRQLLLNAVSEDLSFADHEVAHEFSNGVGRRNMLLHGGRTASSSYPEAMMMLGFDDNTARSHAMEVLRHTELRYRRIFRTAKDGIIILDAQMGHILDANAFIQDLWAWKQASS